MTDGRFEIPFEIDLGAVTESRAKLFPGERFEDRFPDGIDPRGEPDVIEFQWDQQITELKDCDTPHLLYLLQIACDFYRKWVIQRNRYFESITRTDRFIDHVDAPQLITKLLKWHNDDKEQNVFDGNLIVNRDGMTVIKDVIGNIGLLSFFVPFIQYISCGTIFLYIQEMPNWVRRQRCIRC